MCGGGGYASMTKNLLISLGYDQNKIYNVGGYWWWYYGNITNVNHDVIWRISIDKKNKFGYNENLVLDIFCLLSESSSCAFKI